MILAEMRWRALLLRARSSGMTTRQLLEEALTRATIGCFFEVYNTLGVGYPEYIYVRALEWELRARGHIAAREVPAAVYYKGEELALLRLDTVVDGRLVVEAKATDALHPSAMRQLYNYLKSTRFEVGLLLHFGPVPKFYRIVCPNTRKAGIRP